MRSRPLHDGPPRYRRMAPGAEEAARRGGDPESPRPLFDAHRVVLSVVVPVYNEAPVLGETARRLHRVLRTLGEPYELLFVNDGSSDGSEHALRELCAQDEHVGVLTFSRNFGHQVAISAGMERARGEAIIVIDADLQDPPELIPDLFAKWRLGYEVVYAQRRRRRGEGLLKRASAALFYRLLRAVTDVPIPVDTGDFRLIDRKVRDALMRMPEHHRFVRGLVAWLGFRQVAVAFDRDPRHAGETKYSVRKMFALAGDAVLSFSDLPLRLTGYLGALVAALSLILLAVLLPTFWLEGGVPLWLVAVAAFGLLHGVTLAAIGVLGAYMVRIHDEVRRRPLYVLSGEELPGAPGDDNSR